jgi:hypothetical protein
MANVMGTLAMVKINLVVRELGKLKPDYSLDFELPGGAGGRKAPLTARMITSP